MKSSHTRIAAVGAAAAFAVVLLWSYATIIAPVYTYYGYRFAPSSEFMLFLVAACAVLPAFWLPLATERPSTLTLYVLYALVYVPACIVPLCSLRFEPTRFLAYQTCLVACFWLLCQVQRLQPLQLRRAELPGAMFWSGLAWWSLAAHAGIALHFGLSIKIYSMSAIYDVRAEYKDALQGAGGILPYVMLWQYKVITPLLFIQGVRTWNLPLIAGGVVSQLVLFTITAVKSVFFSSFYILALYIVLKMSPRNLLRNMLLLAVVLILLCAVVDVMRDDDVPRLSSLFVRRVMLAPGVLSGVYFDFFSQNPKAHLGHSVLEGFVDYPYHGHPAKVINDVYYGGEGNANANVWSDAYANFGLPGMVAASLVLVGVLWVYDSVGSRVDPRVISLMLAMPSLSLVNSALLTTMLSHGLGLAILLAWLMPSDGVGEEAVDAARDGPHSDERPFGQRSVGRQRLASVQDSGGI